MNQIITRFAPSPTGLLHIGNVRTAILNWLFAKSNNGKFILRIDDTDKDCSKQTYEDAIKRDLEWLGLEWDKTFRQSERMDAYHDAREKLVADNRLYPCYETPEELTIKKKSLLQRGLPPIYDRAALKLSDAEKQDLESQGIRPHWRFLLVDEKISWVDDIRGEMHFKSSNIPDPVLFKENGNMTYNLASVVDDIEYGITNIMRGEDHLTNTATHIQLFKALGAETVPNFAHFSLLYNKEGEISKRLGGFDIASLREQGIEAMAINSFFAKIGSSEPVECYYSLEDLKKTFNLKKFSKSPVSYDFEDLKRFNIQMLHHMPYEMANSLISKKNDLEVSEKFWDIIRGNIESISEVKIWYNICYGDVETVILDKEFCQKAAAALPNDIPWDENIWSEWMTDLKNITGKKGKELFLPIRMALTGKESGPEMKYILAIIGREKTLKRLTYQTLD